MLFFLIEIRLHHSPSLYEFLQATRFPLRMCLQKDGSAFVSNFCEMGRSQAMGWRQRAFASEVF